MRTESRRGHEAKHASVSSLAPSPTRAAAAKPKAIASAPIAPEAFEKAKGSGKTADRSAVLLERLLVINAPLLAANPVEAEGKLAAMAASPFAFFRATADLFFHDLGKLDATRPKVLLNGDAHPQNFGVVTSADGVHHFGLTDFDEAGRGPFAWDLRRASVGFVLAARARGETGDGLAEALVGGYLKELGKLVEDPSRRKRRVTLADAKGPVAALLAEAESKSRKDYLSTRVADGAFIAASDLKPRPELGALMQQVITAYREGLGADAPKKDSFYRVKDVAEKAESGLGSRGLERYYVLLEGEAKKGKDDVVLELKAARRSAVERHASKALVAGHEGARIADALRRQLPDADPLAGAVDFGGKAFVARERSPWKGALALDALSPKALEDFAQLAGKLLARAHVRGGTPPKTAERILASVDADAFTTLMSSFALSAADGVAQDHARFVALRAAGKL